MSRVGQWLTLPKSDPLDARCWLPRYKGATWREVIDLDLPYVEWLLFESDIVFPTQLRSAMEDAVADLIPMMEEEIRDRD